MTLNIFRLIRQIRSFAVVFVVFCFGYTVYLELVNVEINNAMPKIYEVSLGDENWADFQEFNNLDKSEIFSDIKYSDLYIIRSNTGGDAAEGQLKNSYFAAVGQFLSDIVRYNVQAKLQSSIELIDEYKNWRTEFASRLLKNYDKVINFSYTFENTPQNGFVYVCRGVGVKSDGTSHAFEENFKGQYVEFLEDSRADVALT